MGKKNRLNNTKNSLERKEDIRRYNEECSEDFQDTGETQQSTQNVVCSTQLVRFVITSQTKQTRT